MAKKVKKDQPVKRTFRGADIKGGGEQRKKVDEIVALHKFGPDWTNVRLLPCDFHEVLLAWVTIVPKNSEKSVDIPRPVSDLEDNPYVKLKNYSKSGAEYYANAIIRTDKKIKHKPTKAEVEAGHLLFEENSGSPVKVVRFPPGLAKKVAEIAGMGKHDLSDGKFGRDITIKFDKENPGATMYGVHPAEHTPLTPKEEALLMWDLSLINPVPSLEDQEKDAKELAKMAPDSDDNSDYDIDKYAKGGKKKKKKKDKKRPF